MDHEAEPAAEKNDQKAFEKQDMEGNKLHCGGAGEHAVDEPTYVEIAASADTSSEAGTLIEQPVSTVDDLMKESIKGDQHAFSDCLTSYEENTQLSDCLASFEENTDQEESSATQVADESGKQDNHNSDDSLSNSHMVESHNPVMEMEPEVFVEATDEFLPMDGYKASDVAGCKDMISDGVTCEEEESGFGNEDFKTSGSDSVAISKEPTAIEVEHNKDSFPSQRENDSSISQGLSSVLGTDDEVQKDETIRSKTQVEAIKGACLKVAIESNQAVNGAQANSSAESKIDSSISNGLLKTPEETKNVEPAGDLSEFVIRQETCDSDLKNAPEQESFTATKVALNKLQDTVVETISEEDVVVLDSVEVFEVVHGDNNIVEEECTTVVDEECLLAAELTFAVDASIICSSPLPSSEATGSPVQQAGFIGDEGLDPKCSIETKNRRSSDRTEVNPCAQTGNEAPSSEGNLQHGYSVDKDGGSSMDSTAGSGWKLQGTDGQIATEDANSSGGEDSASSPACIHPSSQQRKKINIHHQFVREIVKIQHDREQYDRGQVERQIQAQQAGGLAQLGGKGSDTKEHKSNLVEKRQFKTDSAKNFIRRGLNDHGPDRHMESQQKHATRNKKALLPQPKNGSPQLRNDPHDRNEQGRPPFPQGENSSGEKEHGKNSRGKQQRSMSIYCPPVARDFHAAGSHGQNNMEESGFPYHQAEAHAMNSSPDSSTSLISEPHFRFVGSPNLVKDEGTLKVVRNTSGERYVRYIESQAEQTTPGMGIKVTFDTQKKLRHIEFSDESDLTRGQKQNEHMSLATFDSSSGFGSSRSPGISPLASHPVQDPMSFFGSPRAVSKRQAGFRETLSKGNDKDFSQPHRSSWSQASFSTESFQSRGKPDKGFDSTVEVKGRFFEQAGNHAIIHKSSSWLQNNPSTPLHISSNAGHSGQSTHIDKSFHAEEHVGDSRMPSSLLHGSSTSRSRKAASLKTFYGRDQSVATPLGTSYRRGQSTDDPDDLSMNLQASFQIPQFDVSRSQSDIKGKQKVAASVDGGRKKRESQIKISVKESSSPFQAMIKELNRPQVMFGSPAYHESGNSKPDFQGSDMKWNAVEDRTGSQDDFQESLRRSQSDSTRKGAPHSPQPQLSPLPLKGSAFCTTPLLEKWGDIVDDFPDADDYLQISVEGDREGGSASPLYRANSNSGAGFVSAASFRAEKSFFKDINRDKGSRNHGRKDNDAQRKNKAASEVMQDHFSNEIPARKSVWERLGPQNNYKESILGPPPKVLDNRGVLKPSPDAFTSKTPTMSTFGGFDAGFRGSSQVSHGAHLPSMPHDSGASPNDEGLEVVVQAYTDVKQKRSNRELYVPRRGL